MISQPRSTLIGQNAQCYHMTSHSWSRDKKSAGYSNHNKMADLSADDVDNTILTPTELSTTLSVTLESSRSRSSSCRDRLDVTRSDNAFILCKTEPVSLPPPDLISGLAQRGVGEEATAPQHRAAQIGVVPEAVDY